jgi:hypothetical protein
LVRSSYLGIESGNLDILDIEYLSGAVVRPRPPTPILSGRMETSGRTLTVVSSINSDGQKCAASQLRLWVYPVGTVPDWNTPDATVIPATAGTNRIIMATISKTVIADGRYSFSLRTWNSINGTDDGNTTAYGPVELTVTVPSDPSTFARAGA